MEHKQHMRKQWLRLFQNLYLYILDISIQSQIQEMPQDPKRINSYLGIP